MQFLRDLTFNFLTEIEFNPLNPRCMLFFSMTFWQ